MASKIMLWTESPNTATGLGYLGRQITGFLKKDYDVHYVGWHTFGQALVTKFQIEDREHEFKLYPVFEPRKTDYLAFNHWAKYINPDWILGLGDIQMMMLNNPKAGFLKGIPLGLSDRLIAYMTVDISPILGWMPMLKDYQNLIVPTEWAGKELQKVNIQKYDVIPHPIDTSIWKPIPEWKRKVMKKEHGLPEDAIVIGGIGNNQDRKKWNVWIKIFAMAKRLIEKEYKKPVFGYLHVPTPIVEPTSYYDLHTEIQRYSLANSVTLYGDPYGPSGFNLTHSLKIRQEGMHNVYGICDILLHTAAAGAWELPISEAQACGTLAIANNYAGMSEVCHPDLKVRPKDYETNETGADWAIMDEIGAMEKIEKCLAEREALQKKQYNWVAQYSSERVSKMWLNYFRRLNISDMPEPWVTELNRLYGGD